MNNLYIFLFFREEKKALKEEMRARKQKKMDPNRKAFMKQCKVLKKAISEASTTYKLDKAKREYTRFITDNSHFLDKAETGGEILNKKR